MLMLHLNILWIIKYINDTIYYNKKEYNMTNIYDFALQFEKDSEVLYRDLINNTQSEGIKKILNMLADEEAKHYEIISKMKDNIKELLYESTDILDN